MKGKRMNEEENKIMEELYTDELYRLDAEPTPEEVDELGELFAMLHAGEGNLRP
jgi:hypothetical protein